MDDEELARWLHQNYEEIASDVGWSTQDGTTVPFEELPEKNQEVMLRLARKLQACVIQTEYANPESVPGPTRPDNGSTTVWKHKEKKGK